MTRTPARACAGKKRHDTKQQARNHLERLIRLGAARTQLEVYRCRHCDTWHVGHRIGSSGRRR